MSSTDCSLTLSQLACSSDRPRSLVSRHPTAALNSLRLNAGSIRRHASGQVLLVWMASGANSRYDLNRTTENEATNLGGGEGSLLSPAHTLVKDCKVVVLNEATSVVYYSPGLDI
ncbi:hypothetical protein EDB19DRAFT_1976152 [Suillus lakei]|nr:hypothetical protein EDB19DRAFT_1976152 [Suillus lakei]